VTARNSREAAFSVVRTAHIVTQLCGKRISAAVNQHVTIEEAVFSVGTAPKLYNENLMQLEFRIEIVGCCLHENRVDFHSSKLSVEN
jgi:hypothetical protein